MKLEGKHVLIVGGSSGIGFAVARQAASAGARVAIASSQKSNLDLALSGLPGDVCSYVANFAKEQDIRALFEKVGPIDHLIYTAGDAFQPAALDQIDTASSAALFRVRYWGALVAARYARNAIRPGGSIVLTSSTLPDRPAAGFAVGAGVAGAINALTRSLALELAPVRVNAVAPGVVRTPLWDPLPEEQREAFFDMVGKSLPVQQVGEPDDVAEAYLYLMKSAYATGQILVLDGGKSLA